MEVVSPDGAQTTCSPAAAHRLQGLGWTVVGGNLPPAGENSVPPPAGEAVVLRELVADLSSRVEAIEAALTDDDNAVDDAGAPALVPRGNASREAWATYATSCGVEVDADWPRDEIRDAVSTGDQE